MPEYCVDANSHCCINTFHKRTLLGICLSLGIWLSRYGLLDTQIRGKHRRNTHLGILVNQCFFLELEATIILFLLVGLHFTYVIL